MKIKLMIVILVIVTSGCSASIKYKQLYSFKGGNDGARPGGAIIQGRDGNFYGTTPVGGMYNKGAIFKITPTGKETILYSFHGDIDGRGPINNDGLIQLQDDSLYGTTGGGGNDCNDNIGCGTVFKITPNGEFTSVYIFKGGNDGKQSLASLTKDEYGNLYGTTSFGGAKDNGSVYKITPKGLESIIYSFQGNDDGAGPNALIQGADNNFYGTTLGGVGNKDAHGVVFKITPLGKETVLHYFKGGNDGAFPRFYYKLVQAKDGNFYGTTLGGGSGNCSIGCGLIFKITSNGKESVLYYFKGGNDGESPNAIIQGRDGNFYGTTPKSSLMKGTIFKVTPSGEKTILYIFKGGIDGENPIGNLMQAKDGSIYGTTQNGGIYNHGTIFKIIP